MAYSYIPDSPAMAGLKIEARRIIRTWPEMRSAGAGAHPVPVDPVAYVEAVKRLREVNAAIHALRAADG